MIRLFIALPISANVRKRVQSIITILRPSGRNVKWVNPDNLHLTLRFLGDTDKNLVSHISRLIDKVARGYQPVATVLTDVGCFPNMTRPRVLFLGHSDSAEPLIEIARQIELGVRELEFPAEEKKFKPHLTIGRIRRPDVSTDLIDALRNLKPYPVSITYDRICLYQSTLTPSGPIYDLLHEAQLSTAERFSD